MLALAASPTEIDPDVDVALKKLYDTVPGGKVLAARARGILVFPSIVNGGFIVGAQYGDGALRRTTKRMAITTRLPPRMACRPVCKRLAMRCSS